MYPDLDYQFENFSIFVCSVYIGLLLARSGRLLEMITFISKVLLQVFHCQLQRFIRPQMHIFGYLLLMCIFFCLECQSMHFFSQVTLNESKTKVINFSIVWSSSPDVLQYKPFFSKPEIVEFPTSIPGQKAYAYFYPPSNPNFQGLPDEKPPLLVKTHGKWFIHTFGCFKIIIHFDPSKELCWSFRFIFR